MSLRDHIATRCSSPILDAERRFVYFAINKNCQTSIARHVLSDRAIVRKDDPERHAAALASMTDADLETAYKFAVVRNPFARFLSAFRYLQRRGRFPGLTFDQFVARGDFGDPHFLPQTPDLFAGGAIVVDFLARAETIAEDWREIADRIGAPAALPHENRGEPVDYRTVYTAKTRRIVGDHYADDLRMLGYRF